MLELKDLGELPLRLIFEMVSEVELQAALCFAKGEVLIRPQVARPCSDREVYVLSSLLFKSILRISEELETHQTHFTIVSQNSQPFVALLFRSVLTKWVCLLFLGPLYSPVLLFGPTTWLTGREQEALRSFWSSLNAPLRLSALAFSGLANSLSRLPALMDIGSEVERVSFFTPKHRMDDLVVEFRHHRRSCWPLTHDLVLEESKKK